MSKSKTSAQEGTEHKPGSVDEILFSYLSELLGTSVPEESQTKAAAEGFGSLSGSLSASDSVDETGAKSKTSPGVADEAIYVEHDSPENQKEHASLQSLSERLTQKAFWPVKTLNLADIALKATKGELSSLNESHLAALLCLSLLKAPLPEVVKERLLNHISAFLQSGNNTQSAQSETEEEEHIVLDASLPHQFKEHRKSFDNAQWPLVTLDITEMARARGSLSPNQAFLAGLLCLVLLKSELPQPVRRSLIKTSKTFLKNSSYKVEFDLELKEACHG